MVEIISATPAWCITPGSARNPCFGFAKALAAEIAIIKVKKVKPSVAVIASRSDVTGPPIRIPAIQSGSGMVGKVNKVFPGIGTERATPIIIRIAKAINPSRTPIAKALAQGWSLFLE